MCVSRVETFYDSSSDSYIKIAHGHPVGFSSDVDISIPITEDIMNTIRDIGYTGELSLDVLISNICGGVNK